MKGLKNLVRLHKHRLDERRRLLIELETLRAALVGQVAVLDARLAREAETARRSDEIRFAYTAFAADARSRRETLLISIAETDDQVGQTREQISITFQDMKRYETVLERRQAAAARHLARLEQTRLDEIGLDAFRRRAVI